MAAPIKGFFFDLFPALHLQQFSRQRRHNCADFELNALECLEAYGLHKGYDVCFKYIEDLNECKSRALTDARVNYIKMTLLKKTLTGEIPSEKAKTSHVSPDAFIDGMCYI